MTTENFPPAIHNIFLLGRMVAKAIALPKLGVTVSFEIDEEESRALDAMAGYGDEVFLKAFYGTLGDAYMKRHEAGLRRFLASIRDVVSPALVRIEKARLLLKADDKQRAKDDSSSS